MFNLKQTKKKKKKEIDVFKLIFYESLPRPSALNHHVTNFQALYRRNRNMARQKAVTFFALAFVTLQQLFLATAYASSNTEIPDETWGYVEVRRGAFMFWWLYGADSVQREDKPLLMWLQGGPGSSSTGYGNFEEIGPLDVHLEVRNTTWIKEANILFVDNPVGCGYSYVLDEKDLAANISGK